MTRPLRVSVVARDGVLGGAELWLLSLLDATDRLAVDAVLLADGPLRDEFARRGVSCAVRPTGRSGASIAGAAVWLTRRLRADRPDVVLANGTKAATVAAPAAWLAGVRCVWAKHDHSHDGPLMTLLAVLSDGCVATGAELVTASRHRNAVFVPFPAPGRAALPRETARQELLRRGVPLGQDELLLLTAARLVGYKGLDDAITALAQPGTSRWRLAVIGPEDPAEPDERQRLARLAATLGVADRVDFTGWLQDAWRFLPAADAVAVLTKPTGSGPSQESFGAVALEAMLAGVPVIATAPGPVADRVAMPGADPAGITVEPARADQIAEALRRLEDPDVRAAMGSAGRRGALAHPGPEQSAALLVQTLAEAARLTGAGLDGTAAISVVTTVKNEAGVIDQLLELLVPQLTVDGDEIIVVDGGSTDDTARRVETWASRDPRVRLLLAPGTGISAGRNAGVRAAGNSLIACTDAGCYPAPDWLARLRAAAGEVEAASLLTGVYRVRGRGPVQDAHALVGYPVPEEARHPGPWTRLFCRFLGREFDATLPTGRSVAFTRKAWEDVGGFPEHLRTSEDVLFGRAVVAAGHRAALVASAEVGWQQRPTLRQTATMYFHYGEGNGWSAHPLLLGRNAARAIAYTAAVTAVLRGPTARRVTAATFIAYLSLPLTRAVRERRWAALPAIPVVAVVRDLSKVAGAAHGLVGRMRSVRAGAAAPGSGGPS
ncbi:glycosyltransferase [Streptomyces afghaniensis]|uniref:glycosyltransferase n=1 Tax=Streptomyces afghaniensis TaxID=66865 RepID=UPI0027838EA8|nr:glycosyltransferase [Streptomyces afghaniensis]MDQ1014675.1 glycosyltransferase involved in cell wall biosynthesis/GT2 family glycosyltransferase [Streptomyces afghaniensis]